MTCDRCMYLKQFTDFAGELSFYCNNKYGITFSGNSTYLSLCGKNRELTGCNCGTLAEKYRHKSSDPQQLQLQLQHLGKEPK